MGTAKKATKKTAAGAGKKTAKKAGKKTTRRRRKGEAEPGSRGLTPSEVGRDAAPPEVTGLAGQVAADGGEVLASYRDPLGGHWTVLAALPVEKVEPTPFQRDLSDAHVKRLTDVIDKVGRFLDPIVVVRTDEGRYWTPNGNHRLSSMKRLGAKSVVCLLIPDLELAYRILALNTEKAHNLKEKSLEVIRMVRDLAERDPRKESEFVLEFEEPALITLGICYEQNKRFSGSVYRPILKRLETFLDEPLPTALERREGWAAKVVALDSAVAGAVKALKDRGFSSPYLKAFVVARVNYLRFVKGELPPIDVALDKLLAKAEGFDAGKIRQDQVAGASGPSDDE